jgi:hypothetical protein
VVYGKIWRVLRNNGYFYTVSKMTATVIDFLRFNRFKVRVGVWQGNQLRAHIEGNEYTDDGFYALGESEFLTKLEYPEFEREEIEEEEEEDEEEFEEVEEIVEVDEEEDLGDEEYEK